MGLVVQHWIITSSHDGRGEGNNFKQTRGDAHDTATDAAHHTVAGGRGVAFDIIDLGDFVRQFRPTEKQIGNAATEFASGAVRVRRRIVNVCAAESRHSEKEHRSDERSHEIQLTDFARRRQDLFRGFLSPAAGRAHGKNDRNTQDDEDGRERNPIWHRDKFLRDHF